MNQAITEILDHYGAGVINLAAEALDSAEPNPPFTRLTQEAEQALISYIESVIGPMEPQDEPFLTPNGGFSNMGSNSCRNGLRTQQLNKLREGK